MDWLPGHAVRDGNQAAAQRQKDVWGEPLAVLRAARLAGAARADGGEDLQDVLLGELLGRWDQPDRDLWDVRGPLQPSTHSKPMAWVDPAGRSGRVRQPAALSASQKEGSGTTAATCLGRRTADPHTGSMPRMIVFDARYLA